MGFDHTVLIGFGSNMGDRRAVCLRALETLDGAEELDVAAVSDLYLTEPVGFEEQDWFVNGAARLETGLAPLALLEALQIIEREAGRQRERVRFGPRPLDMDILFYDDDVIDLPQLRVPHPRMHKRRFVLQPLCDIAPAWVHPVLEVTVRHLLDTLVEDDKKVLPYR